MQQVEVETIGLQALQAALAGGDRAFARGVARIDFAVDKQPVAPPGDRFAHHFLGAAFAVHLGGVDQADAQIEPQPERRDLGGALAALLSHVPGAHAEGGHALAGRQEDLPHFEKSSVTPPMAAVFTVSVRSVAKRGR